MPEDKTLPLLEVYITERGVRHRVFRGRKPEQIAWKMEHHAKFEPELVLVEAGRPPATDPGAADPRSSY